MSLISLFFYDVYLIQIFLKVCLKENNPLIARKAYKSML